MRRPLLLLFALAASALAQYSPPAGGGGAGSCDNVGNLLKGNGIGGCVNTKVAVTSPATAATVAFSADNETVTLPNGTVAAYDLNNITTILHDLIFTDATYDIGKSGATRPRDGFFSRNGFYGGTLGATGHVTFEGVTSTGASGTGLLLFNISPAIITPTIASFVNATHTHLNAAGGGTLSEAALALTNITTNDATTSAHGFAPKGTVGTTMFWREDWTLAVPPGGGSGCTTSGIVDQILVDDGMGGCISTPVIIDPTAGRAGSFLLPPGTFVVPATNGIFFAAPTSVTAYSRTFPSTVGSTGIVHEAVSGVAQTETVSLVVAADTDNSIAHTGVDINTSYQVTVTHLGSPLPIAQGGTNGTDAADNGGLVWSNASGYKILAHTTTAGLALLSGNAATPSWSANPPVQAASAASAASQVCVATGASRTCSYIDLPERLIVPAANCNAATAGAGWSTATSNFTPACRVGSNNLGGALQAIPSSGASGQFMIELPLDWDTASQPYINIFYGSGANTSGTVIWTVSSACSKEDGSVTDDPAFNAESAFASQTMATANRTWAKSGQFTAITSGNNCIAGSSLILKVAVSGTAGSNINAYQAVVTVPRLPVVQAE